MSCTKCGKPMPAQDGSGRPRKFCSDACQRAATMEVRRLDTLIARLEKEASMYRIKGVPQYAARADDEILRLEKRLAELIAASAAQNATEGQST